MKKTHLTILLLGFALLSAVFSGIIYPTTVFNILGIAPFMFWGITFRSRGKSSNTKTLPEGFNGLKDSDTTRNDYIRERVEQVDQDKLYTDQVNRVTRQAEEQWNSNHPNFTEIQTNVVDNNYCELVKSYRNAGLEYTDAFTNTLIAIVRNLGSLNGDNLYSIDKTIGEFAHFVESDLCLDCYVSESGLMLNSILKLRDEYGVTFNKPSSPIPSMETIDDDIIEIDEDDLTKDDNDFEVAHSIRPIGVRANPSKSVFTTSNETPSELPLSDIQKAIAENCVYNNPNCESCKADIT